VADGRGKSPGSRKGQIKKGEVRNPSGRPKGQKDLAQALRDEIGDPVELAKYAVRCWRGTENGVNTHAQRWEAFCWIKDNAYGKAPLEISLSMRDNQVTMNVPDLSHLTDEDLLKIQEADRVVVAAAQLTTNVIDV